MTPSEKRKLEEAARRVPARRKLETEELKSRFLEAFKLSGNMSASCEFAGCTSKNIRYHLDQDPEFKALYLEAKDESADRLEEEARIRATRGVAEAVIFQGRQMYKRDWLGDVILDERGDPIPLEIYKPSDRLMELLLKAARPDKFRESIKVDTTVHKGGVLLAPQSPTTPEEVVDWEAKTAVEQAAFRSKVKPK